MDGEGFLTQQQASTVAGVSPGTLLRFAEAGYFKVKQGDDGTQLYSSSDLAEVFGITPQEIYAAPIKSNLKVEDSSILDSSTAESQEATQTNDSTSFKDAASLKSEPSQSIQNQELDSSNKLKRLERVVELQEKVIEQTEARLEDIRKERDWLRQRLEKMEEKSDRDQMLLMVESQKVRSLIGYQQRPGFFQAALGWLGVKSTHNQEVQQQTSMTTNNAAEKQG